MGLADNLENLVLDSKKEEYWKNVHNRWFVVDESDHYQLRRPGLLKKEYQMFNGSMVSLSPKVNQYLAFNFIISCPLFYLSVTISITKIRKRLNGVYIYLFTNTFYRVSQIYYILQV